MVFFFFFAVVSYGEHLAKCSIHLLDGASKIHIYFYWLGREGARNHFATLSGQNLTISGLCIAMNITEYRLAQSHHFCYKSPFHDIYCLKKKYYRLFSMKKHYKAAHTHSCCWLIHVWMHIKKQKIQEQYCNIPNVLNITPTALLT